MPSWVFGTYLQVVPTYQGYLVSLVVGRPDLEIALDVKVPRPHRQVLRYIGFGLVPGRRLSGVTSKLR